MICGNRLMPRIEIRDDWGQGYQIVSSNPAVIGAWLAEICNLLVSANCSINHPVRMDVWPHFVVDRETGRMEPDWVSNDHPHIFKPHQMQKLVDLLNGIEDIPDPPKKPEPSPQIKEFPETFGADNI